jgi:hypothetical protein
MHMNIQSDMGHNLSTAPDLVELFFDSQGFGMADIQMENTKGDLSQVPTISYENFHNAYTASEEALQGAHTYGDGGWLVSCVALADMKLLESKYPSHHAEFLMQRAAEAILAQANAKREADTITQERTAQRDRIDRIRSAIMASRKTQPNRL